MEFKGFNNPVLAFGEDRRVIGDNRDVAKDDLFKYYRAYCGENSYQPFTSENFFRERCAAANSIKQYRPRAIAERRERRLAGIELDLEAVHE